jgi:hypothetical protein
MLNSFLHSKMDFEQQQQKKIMICENLYQLSQTKKIISTAKQSHFYFINRLLNLSRISY